MARAQAVGAMRAAAITQADCHDLVGIATAFPTDADVQSNVCSVMWSIADHDEAGGVRKLLAADGHCVAATALDAFSMNAALLYRACRVLFDIAHYGGADGIAAIRAVDDTLINKLRQASDVIRAAGWADWPPGLLVQLCGAPTRQ